MACKCQELDRQQNIQSNSQAEYSIKCYFFFNSKLKKNMPQESLQLRSKYQEISTTSGSQTWVSSGWAKESWLHYKAICLTKNDVEQTSRFISFLLTPHSCFPKLLLTASQISALVFPFPDLPKAFALASPWYTSHSQILSNPSATAILPTWVLRARKNNRA